MDVCVLVCVSIGPRVLVCVHVSGCDGVIEHQITCCLGCCELSNNLYVYACTDVDVFLDVEGACMYGCDVVIQLSNTTRAYIGTYRPAKERRCLRMVHLVGVRVSWMCSDVVHAPIACTYSGAVVGVHIGVLAYTDQFRVAAPTKKPHDRGYHVSSCLPVVCSLI